MIGRAALLLAILALGGCVTTGEGSVTGGECKVFQAPQYAVRGARSYDQDWIDSTVEGGVGGCKWKRPAARPASLDVPKVAAPKPVKRRSLVARVKAKVWPSAGVAPVEAVPEAPVVAPPSAPRSVIDELLHPSDAK